MKIHGKRKKNFIVELTPYEMETIKTALTEWQIIEGDTMNPDTRFTKVRLRINGELDKFESLSLLRKAQIKLGKTLLID
jgi:hypothetical protein